MITVETAYFRMMKERVWMIKNPSGYYLAQTNSHSRNGSIHLCLKVLFSHTWKQLYRAGYRCVEMKELDK